MMILCNRASFELVLYAFVNSIRIGIFIGAYTFLLLKIYANICLDIQI
jgi:hypothetical protein